MRQHQGVPFQALHSRRYNPGGSRPVDRSPLPLIAGVTQMIAGVNQTS
ncbi:MAG: hypothetical protein Q4C95_08525 [Planctomycetia bacterium]|nr:hypothetical protein [Planctomycetia bacterium]